MNIATPKFGMGASVLRLEDRNFVTGHGRYTDDIVLDGLLHGYVLRSPVAHARIRSIDAEAARAADGVRLVLTGGDVAHLGVLKSTAMQEQEDGTKAPTRDIPILCRDEVKHVGDAVAFVVAESREQAQDAAELIAVDYEGLDAVALTAHALDEKAPLVWPEAGSNQAFHYLVGDREKTERAFAGAAHVTRIDFLNNRLVSNYMEPRAAIGAWSETENRFTLTCGSQGVHGVRKALCQQVFQIGLDKMRVLTPDVGGGFGPKSFTYREYALVLEAAKRLARPVKWAGDRGEHFMVDAHGRDNHVIAEMAMDGEGRFLGLRVRLTANMGAYAHQYGPFIPWMGATMSTGVYHIPTAAVDVIGVYTNTCPVDAYRGAGRPEAAFMIEKLADACARDMNLSPVEIRRRSFIRPEQFPYTTPCGRTYDTGEFAGHLDRALDKAGWNGFAARAEEARSRGRLRGIGVSTYIEACAFAGSEPAHVSLNADGTVTLLIGTQSNGQGHATAYAQLIGDKLDLHPSRITVRQGDTDELAKGGGTGGSRSVPLGGVSAARAGEDLGGKIKRIAADEMEASEADIELENGSARIVGTDRVMDFAAIAKAARKPEDLKGFGEWKQDDATFPNGTHVCEVEIDPETGHTDVLSYTIVDDFGATVNPLLLEGQVHGGVAQGLGQALTEDTIYSEEGQLLTASFMDYGMPRADNFPDITFETRNVPSTNNALGMKGAGEAGTIGSTPAVLSAVTDALYRGYGIGHIEMPATPLRVWQAIQEAAHGPARGL